jgi:transposase
MAEWMIKLGEALKPLIRLMQERILDGPVVHADETPVKVLTKDGVRTSHQAYMWQLSRWGPKPLVVFGFDMSRKKEVAEKLLGTYEGFVQIDAYAGYDLLFGETSPRIRYADDELPHIRHYLKHGAIELDNNLAENSFRPFALGRRNWMFICTEDGAQASANIYSLLITAKANGIEPVGYLPHVIERLPYYKTVEDFEALLPTQ